MNEIKQIHKNILHKIILEDKKKEKYNWEDV